MQIHRTRPLHISPMIAFNDFQTAYLHYAAHHRLLSYLEDTHSYEDLNELMLLIAEGEEKILQSFGLPCTVNNSLPLKIYCSDPDFGLADIPLLYEELRVEAKRYLTGSVLMDLQVLKFAQQWGLHIDEVLPQISLRLKAEAYCHFLYVEYFLPGSISPATFLEEIRVVANNKLATRIHLLSLDAGWRESSEYKLLFGFELNYLQEFLEGYAEFKKEHETKVDFIN